MLVITRVLVRCDAVLDLLCVTAIKHCVTNYKHTCYHKHLYPYIKQASN